MEQIVLAEGGRRVTTRLGFGCSSLMAGIGRRESLRLLETAYDAGIRHFDVAPMYGYGEAESCLGEFIERHRNDVTLTTKYGIAPPKRARLLRAGRRLAEPVFQRVPSLKRRLARAAGAVTVPAVTSAFNPDEARASLENSFRLLRTDFIDLWLLHEPEAGGLRDERLLQYLRELVTRGRIGAFGVGSDSAKLAALLHERPAYCRVIQHDWSVLDAHEPASEAFHVHHRALTDHLRTLHDALLRNPQRLHRWSQAINFDLARREQLAALMLKAALVLYPNTILLVSSKNPAHIRQNVHVADDASLEAPARRLYDLVQREGLASAAN